MLCPNCGVEVGGEIRLCDNCVAEKAARENPTPSGDAASPDGQTDSNAPRVRNEDSDVSATRILIRKVGPALLLGLIIIGFAVAKMGLRSGSHEGGDPAGSSSSGAAVPSASPAVGSILEERPVLISIGRAAARLGGAEVKLGSSFARYNRSKRQLEVAFYRDVLTNPDHTALADTPNILQAAGVRPDLVVAIVFRPGTTQCDPQAVTDYHVTAYKNAGGFVFNGDSATFEVKSSTTKPASGTLADLRPLLDSIQCSFEDGTPSTMTLRGSKATFVRDDQLTLSWDLSVASAMLTPEPPSTVTYSSKGAASSVAMWDPEKRELNIGFYAGKVSARSREVLREKRSLSAIAENQPDAVMTFSVGKTSSELTLSEVKTFGVQLYRSHGAQLDFPGSDESIGAFFVGGAQNSGTLENLAGNLVEGSRVGGAYAHSLHKTVGGRDVTLEWQLKWYSVVLDLSVPPKTLLNDGPEDLDVNPDELPSGPILSVTADQVTIEGKSAVGLYYPETGDVAVGIFSEELSDAERHEIAQRGTLSSFVNHKRPVMVLYFDFPPGQKDAAFDALDGYTVYFYRGNGSAFQFAGNQDAVSMKRNRSQLTRAEIRMMSGSLVPGSTLHLEMVGRGTSAVNPTKFAWRVSQDVQILTR